MDDDIEQDMRTKSRQRIDNPDVYIKAMNGPGPNQIPSLNEVLDSA